MAGLLPLGKQTFTDANGIPLAGGTVTFYVPGTTTPKATYQNATATILNTNPVLLDSAGRGVVYGIGAYRQVVKDALGNTIWDQNTNDPASIVPAPSPTSQLYLLRVNAAGDGYETVDPATILPSAVQPPPIIVDNANFAINQRGISGTKTLAAGEYGFDRWKAGTGGCTFTVMTAGTGTTLNITAGSLLQVIEGANFSSTTYTLAHDGTAQARVYQSGAGAYAATPLTKTGMTAGSATTIEFSTGTVKNVRFSAGSSATTFVPRTFAADLLECRRYYQKGIMRGKIGSPTNYVGAAVNLSPSMRATPSASYTDLLLNPNCVSTDAGNANTVAGGQIIPDPSYVSADLITTANLSTNWWAIFYTLSAEL